MGQLRPVGFGGPVGFFFASIGFSSAVLVARVWEYVAEEAHCTPLCPSFTLEALRLHHFYYGVGLLLPSLTTLIFARRQRVRWDAALALGMGMADILTTVSILLGMAGILYLDRPLQIIVEAAGLFSWISALVLLVLYGKRHFLRVWPR